MVSRIHHSGFSPAMVHFFVTRFFTCEVCVIVDQMTPFSDRVISINVHYSSVEWRRWFAEASALARIKQAELMSMVDFQGLLEAARLAGCSIAGDDMPMLWPLDPATFEFCKNKPAKNSTKPGDVLACPTFSGPAAVVEVVSRKGKQQRLKILRGPDSGSFMWHADHNNLFFRCVGKRDLKKLRLA
jgi:hypothetical protein